MTSFKHQFTVQAAKKELKWRDTERGTKEREEKKEGEKEREDTKEEEDERGRYTMSERRRTELPMYISVYFNLNWHQNNLECLLTHRLTCPTSRVFSAVCLI